ncbi:MAG: S8 family serine peptidase, partial [Actinomycetota bacterium]|nr:S8 family serine peptidase [Actinomycetota bacterium]
MPTTAGRSLRHVLVTCTSAGLLGALMSFMVVPTAGADGTLPDKLDPNVLGATSPRAIVVFDHDVGGATIRRLARAGISHARVFDAIDAVAVLGSPSAYIEVAKWQDVQIVEDDSRVWYSNHVAKVDTRVSEVRNSAKPLGHGYTGAGVTIAVVDSGVDTTHPDVSSRIAANVNMEPSPLLDPITDGEYSEAHAEAPVGTDEFGHGTHVAGIVGGTGAAARGADLSGVAPGATLINCKMGLSVAFEVSALACYQWILDHRNDERFPGGIRVATNSWEIYEEESDGQPLELMAKKAVARNITLVFAAGNSGEPQDDEETAVGGYVNRMELVITVGATCKSEGSNQTNCDPLE